MSDDRAEQWPSGADAWGVEAWRRHANYLRSRLRVHTSRAERAEAKLAEVRALADGWEGTSYGWVCQSCAADNFGEDQRFVDQLRAALEDD